MEKFVLQLGYLLVDQTAFHLKEYAAVWLGVCDFGVI